MEPRVEDLFRLREEFQLEVDPLVKEPLRDKLFTEVTGHDFGVFVEDFEESSDKTSRERRRKQHIGVEENLHLRSNSFRPSSFIR